MKTSLICVLAFAGIASVALSQQAVPPVPGIPAILEKYAAVTDERLKTPEPENWLMVRRTYDGWGFSPLEQIKKSNVGDLKLAWVILTGQNNRHEAAPVVNNGVMFISAPGYQVLAIDVKAGRTLWTYKRNAPTGGVVAHQTSRGV